jgi:hypothetical protein
MSKYIFTARCTPSNCVQLSVKPSEKTKFNNSSKSASSSASSVHKNQLIRDSLQGVVHASKIDLASLPPGNYPDLISLSASSLPPAHCEAGGGEALGISAQSQSPEKRDRFSLPRRTLFTRKARSTLLDAAGALEKEGYRYSEFFFFTGTLPGSTSEASKVFSCYSGYLTNALKSYLRYFGLDLTFNTWEWQLRKKANLVPALHLHLVVVCVDLELQKKLPDMLKAEWFRLLDKISNMSGIDLYARHQKLGGGRWSKHDLEKIDKTVKTIRCEKSPAAYLSKYVGKGSLSSDKEFQNRFKKGKIPLYYPKSWWSVSYHIKELIKKHSLTIQLQSNNLDKIWDCWGKISSILEDTDLDLCQLILNPFHPKWDCSDIRCYQNFYSHSETYDMVKDLISTFDGQNGNGEFKNDYSNIATISKNKEFLQAWMNKNEHWKYKEKLYYSIPFYCRLKDGDIYWDSLDVQIIAKNIINEFYNLYKEYDLMDSLESRNYQLRNSYINHYGYDKYLNDWIYPILINVEF